MYCPKCSSPAAEGQRFCRQCGTNLGAIVDAMEGRRGPVDLWLAVTGQAIIYQHDRAAIRHSGRWPLRHVRIKPMTKMLALKCRQRSPMVHAKQFLAQEAGKWQLRQMVGPWR